MSEVCSRERTPLSRAWQTTVTDRTGPRPIFVNRTNPAPLVCLLSSVSLSMFHWQSRAGVTETVLPTVPEILSDPLQKEKCTNADLKGFEKRIKVEWSMRYPRNLEGARLRKAKLYSLAASACHFRYCIALCLLLLFFLVFWDLNDVAQVKSLYSVHRGPLFL